MLAFCFVFPVQSSSGSNVVEDDMEPEPFPPNLERGVRREQSRCCCSGGHCHHELHVSRWCMACLKGDFHRLVSLPADARVVGSWWWSAARLTMMLRRFFTRIYFSWSLFTLSLKHASRYRGCRPASSAFLALLCSPGCEGQGPQAQHGRKDGDTEALRPGGHDRARQPRETHVPLAVQGLSSQRAYRGEPLFLPTIVIATVPILAV